MKRYKLCTRITKQGTVNEKRTPEGTLLVAEAPTVGEARALFKGVLGEKPQKHGKGRNKTTRKRLPQGFRVRELNYGRAAT